MAAAAHDPAFAKRTGISQSVAKEFNKADTGTKQLSNAMKHKEEESCGMEESSYSAFTPDEDEAKIQHLMRKYHLNREEAENTFHYPDQNDDPNELYGDMEESVPAVNSCRQENSADADIACAMEEGAGMHDDLIGDALAQFDDLMASHVDPQEAINLVMSWQDENGVDPEALKAISDALMSHASYDDGEPNDSMDGDFDSAMASAGQGSDEDYGYYGDSEEFEEERNVKPTGKRVSDIDPNEINSMISLPHEAAKARAQEILAASTTSDNKKSYLANQINRTRNTMAVIKLLYDMVLKGEGHGVQGSSYSKKFDNAMEEAFDLNNGYDDINDASGNDYFPSGAVSPVVKATGPSGARHGDNPEQKKMQVAEVHKELVYGYRNFLKESSQKKKLTESQQVSNLSIQDIGGDLYTTDDEVILDGGLTVSGKAVNLQGEVVEINFDIDVKANAGISWEEDEQPTGWNYKTDSITYSSSYRPELGDIIVSSVEFSEGMAFYINNEDLYLKDAQRVLGPNVMKQLLNPAIYQKLLVSAFDKKIENIDPPEQDYHEPERSDSRY
jgi:hypothetical protein